MPTRKMGAISELPFETARERDLYLYYQPLFSQRFAPDHIPRSSCDTTLSAFAQLATLRLSTRRALISLIDRTNEHILAEATQTLSLQSDLVHNDQDELWFGCTTLPRSLGLCEKALEILPPAKRGPCPVSWSLSPLIINDLTRDDRFKDRPFITSRPSLRFYAAMPIRTKSGFHIGTLSVMDDRPRKGLNDAEIRFLNDMVITIMAHLEMTRVKEAHRRGEKMVKGLGIFVEGRSPLHEWWLDTKTNEAWGPHDSKDGADAQSRMKGKSQSDSDSTPALKEHISVSNAMKPEVVGHFESQDSPSPRSYPKLAVDTLAKVKGHRAAESQPVLSTHRESDPISIVSSSRSQERLSCLASASNTSTAFAPTRPSKEEGQHPAGSKQNVSTFATDLQETMLSTNLKDMFSRASNIIRECIEVDGTIFLDAAVGTFGGRTGESHRRLGRLESMGGRSQESIISFGKEERWRTPTGDTETSELSIGGSDSSQQSKKTSAEGHDEKKKTCGILGLSTAEKSGLGGDEASGSCVPVTETFLQSLLRKYPRGQVFDLCEGGALIPSTKNTRQVAEDVAKAGSRSSEEILPGRKPRESAKQAEAKAILQMLPGARNVIFSPLWDSRRERWFAGSFAWTTRARRVLTRTEDLNYLTAFGNSVMADVARLDAVAADQAKSDFISSVSHELRTPLHGILASVEFLQDTTVDLFQDSMIDTIERCGRTLLDTIQHVLDFAKINNFTKPKKKERKVEGNSREGSPSSTMGLNIDVDLSVITEDVIDAMYAGDEFQRNSSLVVADEAGGFPSEDNDSDTAQKQSVLKKERLEVIMDIGWRSNWAFNTQSGALRRILMNLFGNALKYTDAGWVKVSLQSKDIKSAPSQSQQSVITITVSDSGRGISQEFLHNHLFTPFTQENSMNPGTGLGLSIVLQIVRSLGGTIDVKSEQGVGTEVKVSLTLIQVPLLSELPMDVKYENLALSVRKNTSRLTLGLVGFDTHSSISKIRASTLNIESEPSLSLQSSLEDMATVWFDMKVAPSASWKTSPPDIYIANETPGPHGAFGGAPIIVLCSNASMHRAYARRKKQVTHRKDNGLVYFVAKPCGPHKLAKAFAFCLGIASQSRTDRRSRVSPLPTPLGNLDSPQSLFEVSLRSPGLELSVHPGEQQLRGEYFPISAGLPPRIPSRPSESSTSAADSRMVDRLKPKLLLVEDNEINLRLLETFISKNNFEYDTAVNGLLALQAFQNARRPYDIVFMDISMPVMNGMESSREIRNLERERGQKPAMIIALTGVASATAQQDAFSTGINVFLTKPVRFSELRKILNDWTPYEDMQESKAC